MSDRPENPNLPHDDDAQPQPSGGWRAPTAPTSGRQGWQSPAQSAERPAGWRVQALPPDMDVNPAAQGGWHLPQPDDTVFNPGDEIEITREPAAPPAAAPAPEPAEPAAALPFDDAPAVQREAEPDADAAEPADAFLPFDDVGQAVEMVTGESDEPAGAALDEAVDEADVAPAAEPTSSDEPEVDEGFSASELFALASLVDDTSAANVVSEEAPPLRDTADDPAAFARQQYERLIAEQQRAEAERAAAPPAEAAPAEAVEADFEAEEDEDDPAAYAREQLAALRGGDAALSPTAGTGPTLEAPELPAQPAAPELTSQQQDLLQRYRQTEQRVAELKGRYQNGEISREQLQADLRQLMVLDDNQVWWMMGVESDTWYKFEDNEWQRATPAVIEMTEAAEPAEPAARPAYDEGSGYQEPADAAGGYQAPGDTQAGVSAIDDFMALPRSDVPTRDPEATMPNTAGMYVAPDEAAAADFDATLPHDAYDAATMPAGTSQETMQAAGIGTAEPAEAEEEVDVAPPDYDTEIETPVYDEARQRQQRSALQRALIAVGVVVALVFLMGACGIGFGLMQYNNIVEPYRAQIAGLADFEPEFRTVSIFDAQGDLIVELTSQDGGAREEVALANISPYMVHAIVSSENERFFVDPGWDAFAIARAFIQNLTAGEIESGGSTITQQLARRLILQDTTVSPERKLQEIVVAAEIARQYSKAEILELYLNNIFFGNQSYGVEAAADFYFDKAASELNAAESALLAAIVPAPAEFDPVTNRERAFEGMNAVLERMRRVGCLQFTYEPYANSPFCITNDLIQLDGSGEITGGAILIERAEVQTTDFVPREFDRPYPHFVNFIEQQVQQTFGADEMFRRGFNIYTTLIPRIQDGAQTILINAVDAAEPTTGLNTGAVMVTNPSDGAIRAMVGSPDFNDAENAGQNNNVFAWNQSGSAIKPILYTAALIGGTDVSSTGLTYYTPATILWDVPTIYETVPQYAPVNFDGRFRGPVALRFALQNSYNVPAVRTYDFVGDARFREVATRMGIRFRDDAVFGLPSGLGANDVRLYDMMIAYGTLANQGQRVPLYAIERIEDYQGNPVDLPDRPEPVQAVPPPIAFLMQNILSDNSARQAAFGLNSGLTLGEYPNLIAAKTGTTNDNRDLWTMGFTTNMVVGVWTGRVDDGATSANTGTAAIPIWNDTMRRALQGTNPSPFANPGGIINVTVCAETGTQYDPNAPCASQRSEFFWQEQPPPPASEAWVRDVIVDTWTGLRVNQFCPDATTESARVVAVNDPFIVAWLNSPAGAPIRNLFGLTDPVIQLPPECSSTTNLPIVRINQPTGNTPVEGTVQIVGAATGPNFARYQVELATPGGGFQIVAGPFTTPQPPGSVLATLDTTEIPNGIYTLRLVAFSDQGGFIERDIQIGINNPEPTATPIPTPTETPFVPPVNPVPPTLPPDLTPISPGNGQPLLPGVGESGPSPTPDIPGLGEG